MRILLCIALWTAASCTVAPSSRPAPVDPQRAYTRTLASDSAAAAACGALRTQATSGEDTVYLASEVDTPAADPTTRGVFPTLPPHDAAVIAVAVVHRDGRAESGGVQIVRATDALTGEAVRRFLAHAPFTPARRGGRVVSQCLVVPFTYRVGQ